MMIFDELTEKNVLLYAAKYYYKPQFSDVEEFYEDLKRFKYIKRLVNRYLDHDELMERLILNHIIVLFNSFGNEPALNILDLKLDDKHWPVIKPFLIYLNYITMDQKTGITMDPTVVDRLRKI
tara:strand:+ start:952 stop:1320 length:369 start_codon:yes stop_codon:yes gene_type:complete